MIDTNPVFINEYIAAFDAYLADGQEAALGQAYELGREALGLESGLFVITAAHHEALHKSLSRAEANENERIIKRATEFLSECLSPFEMAQRGFQDSIVALNKLNKTLDSQEKDLHLLLSPMPNLLLTVDKHDCLAALFVPTSFPPILKLQKVGTSLLEVLPNEIASQIMVAVLSVRQSNQVSRLECPLTISGETLYFDLQISPVDDSYDVLLVIDDITQRKEIEIAEHRQRILAEGLRDTAIALNSSLDLDEVLNRIVVSIGRVVPHDTANIMLINENSAHMVRSFGYVDHNLEAYEKSISDLHLSAKSTPTLQHVIESKQTIIVADLSIGKNQQDYLGLGLNGSAVSVPIIITSSIIGLINLNSFKRDFFTANHAENLQIFANQAAVAIQNARLFEQAQEAAALNERQRLARDLHDSVSQSLFSASVIAESLPGLWKRDSNKVLPVLVDLHQLIKGTLAEMRLLLWELRPASLVTNPLDKLLAQLVAAVQGQTSMTVTLTAEHTQGLPEDVHIVFYRVAQEALNNIVKHSRATQVSLQLDSIEGKTILHIHDDGLGFDTEKISSGFGLNNMRERAETIGALFGIMSEPAHGTQITLSWALPPNSANQNQ
jgi:signal transduction histidine kinase